MSDTADAIVIGAGIVGAACADVLASEGLRVLVVDAGCAGGGATAAGMGHVVVMDDSEPQFALTRFSRELWHQLAPSLPRSVEWEARGTLWIAADEQEMAEVRRKHDFCTARGVRATMLDTRELAEAEPNLRDGLAGALLVPDDVVLYAPCAAAWLVEHACNRGAVFRSGIRVTAIEPGAVRLADGSRVSAAAIVCATAIWAVELFPELPVRPRKGHLAIADRYPGFVHHQLVELGYLRSAHGAANESVAFNVQPRATGQLLIGSSRQFDVTHSEVDSLVLRRMLARSIEYMPAIAGLSIIRVWTGLRAATPDHLPIIGPMPGYQRVYVATGHEGLGITMALGTAQLIAACVTDRAPAIPLAPYSAERVVQET
ncbi:MAG TPA: FAD-dependent oxidoreductase, partial [Bryobacteraceae bacterium]|nr:FAD-dependent oxidoreductase [Bryobacteraceae bacterium]